MLDRPVEEPLSNEKSYVIPYDEIDKITFREGSNMKAGTITITKKNGKTEKFDNTTRLKEESMAN